MAFLAGTSSNLSVVVEIDEFAVPRWWPRHK